MAWYNKYRPTKWEDVIGQEIVKKVLISSLEHNKVKNAYLLSGPKGTGKTTLARIFANQLNHVENNRDAKIDIVELDAASNTGIDEIRRLIDSAKTPPLNSTYKIFIIDEVHMLSKPAMNALLKILEEPPKYLVFLLATTNPEKLIPTVLSRLTKLNLTNHSIDDLVKRMDFIAKNENLNIDQKSLQIIAKRAGGSQRDAINLLETLSSFRLDNYTANDTSELLGQLNEEILEQASDVLLNLEQNRDQIKNLINLLERKGMDGETFLIILLEHLLDKSLSGDISKDALIDPVSQLLSLKLPINTVASCLALLQNRIKPSYSINTEISKKKVEITAVETSIKKAIPAPFVPDSQPQIKESKIEIIEKKVLPTKIELEPTPAIQQKDVKENVIPEDIEKKELQTHTDKTNLDGAKNINPEEVVQFVKNLRQVPGCLPALKIIIDLKGEYDSQNNNLILSVSNGIFQSALKSSKVQNWIIETFNNQFDTRPTIEVRIGQNTISKSEPIEYSPAPIISDDYLPTTEDLMEMSFDNVKTESPNNQDVSRQNIKSHHEDKIFYKMFKKIPKNMQDKGVVVYDKEIPDPRKKKSEQETNPATHSDWDQHLDSFDFE